MPPLYASRERIKAALDTKLTARNDAQVDAAGAAASRDVESDLRRRFYPEKATRTFIRPSSGVLFPVYQAGADLVAVESVTVGGTAVAAADYDLLPVNGPPYTRIQLADTVTYGSDRRSASIVGTWGLDNRTEPAGTLAAAISDTTTTTVDVSDSSVVGVGDLLTVDSERLLVTERAMVTTGQTMQGALGASPSEVAFAVTTGSAYHVGEVLLVDSERLLVVDVVGNTLVVRRQWDGSVIAGHSGATIYALRRLTVERAATGTTAATHSFGAAVRRQVYPGPVTAYSTALAVVQVLGEVAGYVSEVGDGTAEAAAAALKQVRDQARQAYRRLLLA